MSDRAELIDDAVDRLVAAYRDAGLPPIEPAPDDVRTVLDAVAREIAPLRLPAQVDRFWRLVDPWTVSVAPWPRLDAPGPCLESWTAHRDGYPSMTPRLLFPIAYASHAYLFTELDDGYGEPGAIVEWSYGATVYEVRFGSLAGYLDLLATTIELGEFERNEHEGDVWFTVDGAGAWRDAQLVRLAAVQPLPRLGTAHEIPDGLRNWPEHWQASNGVTEDTRTPHGATTTIAALLADAVRTSAPVTGTIHATVTSLVMSGIGSRVSLDDGTGVLDVWCPAAVCTFGPVIRTASEFDVVVRPGPSGATDLESGRADVERRALAGDLDGAQEAARDLAARAFDTPATAEATAIRPLD